MPVTIQPTSLKYKNLNNEFQAINTIKGDDGISPTVTVTDITNGHRVTITDTNGAHNFDVMDGEAHALTAADKAEIAQQAAEDVDVPVQDVQVNGTSVVMDGVANVPLATSSQIGVVRPYPSYGTRMIGSNNDLLATSLSTDAEVKAGTNQYKPIVPSNQHLSAFYALAKAAGADMKDIANTTVGVYPDAQKEAIQQMLGISQMLAPENSNLVASQAYAIGDVFTANGKLYKATNAIAQDAAIIPGTNCTETTIVDESIKDVQVNGVSILQDGVVNVPIADTTNPGAVIIGSGLKKNSSEKLAIDSAGSGTIKAGTNISQPIVPGKQHESAFYGLAKAAGVDMASSSNSVGTYTNDAKVAIRNMIGALGTSNILGNGLYVSQDIETGDVYLGANVEDVQVNGTSVVSNGVANIPMASTTVLGVSGVDPSFGILVNNNGKLYTNTPSLNEIKAGSQGYKPIVPANVHTAAFYGLAKAAGADMASSNNSVGTYTDEAKTAIRSMLGVQNFNPQSIAIVANGDTHAAITSGQYVYVQNHSTLTEGLYAASSAITADEALTVSNLTAVGSGGLNALLGKIPEQLIYLGTETNYPLSAAHTEYPIGITLMYTLASTAYPYGTGTVITIRSAAARCVQLNFSNSPNDYKLRTADSNGWSDWKSLKDVPGITDLQKAIGIVVDGNKAATAVTSGQFVILKNTTISGKADGLYTAAKAIPANTAIDGTYLTAVSGGGLNTLKDYMNEIGQIIVGTSTGTVEVPNNTVTEIGSITLPAGHYIIVGCCDWAFGDTGYRQIAISNTTATLNPSRNRAVTTPAIQTSGKETYQQVVTIISTSGETIRLYGLHSQGSALNAYPYMYAIKVGNL